MSSGAGRGEYLRNKSPRVLYNAAQRSWYDRQIETPREFLQASLATAVTEVLSDEMLQLLGEGDLYPLAVQFYQGLTEEEIDEAMRRVRHQTPASEGQTFESQTEAAAERLVRERLQQVKTVISDYYCEVDGTFEEFDPDTATELRERRRAQREAQLDEIQILRDPFEGRASGPAVRTHSGSALSRGAVTAVSNSRGQRTVSFSTADERHRGSLSEDELDAQPA